MTLDPIALDEARKGFWREFWDETVEDAAIEYRLDRVKFGPLLAFLAAGAVDDPSVNFVLGAEMPGALEGGHLEDALAWLDSHDAAFRVPVLPGSPEAVAAEARLEALGQERAEGPALLVRDVSPIGFRAPPGVNLHEHVLAREAEGLCDSLADSLGLPGWASTNIMGLCEVDRWHCFSAATSEEILAYGMVWVGSEFAMLTLASLSPGDTDGQPAVLECCIGEARAGGCASLVVADAGFDPDSDDWDGLIEAGFEPVASYATWSPPVGARR